MSILTKICVVLLVVASLVASVVFTSLATVQPNWRASFEQEKQAYSRLEAKAREYMAETERLKAELTTARQGHTASQGKLQTELDQLRDQKRQLTVANAKLTADISRINLILEGMKATDTANSKTNEDLQKQLMAAYAENNKIRTSHNSTADALKREQAKYDLVMKNLKIAQEQMADLQAQLREKVEEIADLRQKMGKSTVDETATTVAALPTGEKITGTVTAVDDNIASINIGSAHGVKKGMELIMYRGASYIGKLKVAEVRVSESVGMVTSKNQTPAPGDKVTNQLN